MIRGRCLCGEVCFEVTGEISVLENCHCSECRRAYGAAFGTVAVTTKEGFSYVSGADRIRRYRQSDRVNRYFCERCGSPLPMVEDWDPLVGVPAGVLEDDPGVRVSAHIFVGSKAPWWEISDALPQHEAYPPGEDMNERAEALRSDDRDTSTTWQLEGNAAEGYDRVVVPAILGPFAWLLVDHAAPRPGDTIVDVGCGTGAASLYASTVVGAAGRVIGVDLNAEMLGVARRRARESGQDIEWREADACSLPLDAEMANKVVCAQTLQFVPERSAALAEMRRILKPGGCAAIGAWCPLAENPYFDALVGAVDRRIGSDVAQGLRAACAIGDVRELCFGLSRAGFSEVTPTVVERTLELPPLREFVEAHVLATPMAAAFRAAAPAVRQAIIDDVDGAFESARIPFRSHVVVARA